MPSYKLTYFHMQGLAEPIRFILSYGGVEFEDVRVDRPDWPKIKPTMPFGQVPVLEIDGKKIQQSAAILRYLGKQFGIAGKNDWEALEIDAAVGTIDDLRIKIGAWAYDPVPESKALKEGPLFNELIPYYLERLDAQVKANGGYLVGGTLSWADLFFIGILEYVNFNAGTNIIEKYENLTQLRDKVLSVPNIKAWVEKRPYTER